eukprot:Hpha_TRINITY_DN10099_c0_g1::TRINITY_DN10099_c0_g1_i1::g.83881::m.83881
MSALLAPQTGAWLLAELNHLRGELRTEAQKRALVPDPVPGNLSRVTPTINRLVDTLLAAREDRALAEAALSVLLRLLHGTSHRRKLEWSGAELKYSTVAWSEIHDSRRQFATYLREMEAESQL